MRSRLKQLSLLLLGALALGGAGAGAGAANLKDAAAVPLLSTVGQEDYRLFLAAGAHRAFAIAPGGAWGWKADAPTAGAAADEALEICHNQSFQKCLLYAVDDKVVFDAEKWPRLWGPYLKGHEARRAAVGVMPGERFPNLRFTGPDGRQTAIAALKGKVVVVHLWGSWCGPCRREMPQLEKLYLSMTGQKEITFVVLPVRESLSSARQWRDKQGLRIALHDSGSSENAQTLPLADGKTMPDRELAPVFPTTYVLDKHGVVVFSHSGPLAALPDYAPFLLDTVRHSGK